MTWKWKKGVSTAVLGSLLLGLLPLGGVSAATVSPIAEENASDSWLTSGQSIRPLSVVAAAAVTPTETTQSSAIDDERRVIVTFKDKKKAAKSLIKGKIKRQHKHSSSISAKMTSKEIEKLKKNADVQSVEPDIQLQIASQTMDWGVSVVNATYAWNNGYTGKGVKVAVLDSGIDTHHEDLTVAGGASFVDYTTSYDDDNGHGTHVAGVIGAKNNDVGVVGVAPDAELYALKVLDSTGKGYLSDVIAGIDWAVDNKMDVLNMSLTTSIDSPALHNAVDQAYANGLLVVAAAGNTGNAEGSGDTIQYPAKYSSVIAVGAVDQNNQRAAFSATGSKLELVAPGVGVASTSLHGYDASNGTSMAASFVTGELALLKQQNAAYSNAQLRNLLDVHVTDLGDSGKDPLFGYGLLNIASTLNIVVDNKPDTGVTDDVYNSVYGNVYAAISALGTYTILTPPYDYTHIQVTANNSTLADGRVLLLGSEIIGHSGAVQRNYIYDVNSNTVTPAADMPFQISGYGESTLKDGRILITGGSDINNRYYDTSFIYDPVSNTWTQVASMPYSKILHGQSTLLDGRVLVTGGLPGANADPTGTSFIYDPVSNKWSTVASLPLSVSSHSQSTLVDGRVMVNGGNSFNTDSTNKIQIYNPITNTWSSNDSLPIHAHRQTTLKDGRIFLTSGSNTYLYDPSNNSLLQGISLPMDVSRQSLLPDGKVILTGYGKYDVLSNSLLQNDKIVIMAFNQPPTITVNNTNQTVWSQAGYQTITLTGTAMDKNNDTLTVSATINGVTKSTSLTNTTTAQNWTLQWDINTDHIPAGTYTNLPVTVNDGSATATANFTGSVIVEQAPYAPSGTSPGSTVSTSPVMTSLTPTLKWTFSDPDAGDTQSAYEVIIYNAAGTAVISDSGWVSSSATSYTVPDGKLTRGTTYSWIVKVKDSKGAISPNSALLYIRINTLPILSITSYTDGQQVSDNVLNFAWTYNDADGQAQTAYQILGSQNNWATVAYNSGVVNTSAASMSTQPLASGTWSFKVLVSDGIDWSVAATRNNLTLPNAFEPNDTSAQAFPVNYGQSYSSLINTATDVDFFKYTASATGVDRITMNVPSGLNYDVYIYDSSLNLIAAGVKSAGIAENVLYDVTAGSTYYIKIVGAGGNYSASVPYSFTVNKLSMQLQTNYQYDSNGNITGKTTTKNN